MWEIIWHNMFSSDEVFLLEKILRPTLVYFFLMIGLRIAGKRELAQLNSMDLIVLLTISNTVQNAIIGRDDTVWGGLVGAATLLAVNSLIVRFLYGHEKIDLIIEGAPTTLIEHGKIMNDHMKRELVTVSELEIAAHKQGFASLELIETATLEAGGVICFVGKEPPLEDVRQRELTQRLDEITNRLEKLQAAVAGRA